MSRWISSATILVFAAGLAGCAGPGRSGGITKETGGAVIGGIAGGVLGSRIGGGRGRTVATIAGAILGGIVGGSIGKKLDERDKLLMARTTQTSLETSPSGRSSEWKNPDTGHRGTVTPEPSYKSSRGETCRPFTQTIVVDGKNETAKGTACRNPDGTWRIIR
ncbi:RT0821/Lpp0805 family surface protein [Nitrospinota bacterium]